MIVKRHHADPAEADRVCRGCGGPWPCDVRRLAELVSVLPAELMAAPASTPSLIASTLSRPRRLSAGRRVLRPATV
jgi:hypothetical protein